MSWWTKIRHFTEQPLKSVSRIPFVQPIADVAALATGNPELIPLINGGLTYAKTGSIGQGALAGGEALAGQELAGAVGIGSGNSAFNNALGITTTPASTGLPNVGGWFSNAYNNASNGISGLGSSISNAIGLSNPDAYSGILSPAENSFLTNATQASGSLSPGESSFLSNAVRSSGIGSAPIGAASLAGASGGGGSTFNIGGALASALGGVNQDSAIKKAQKQLLAANNAQAANLDTFDPSKITSDPGYQFNLDQGNLALNRSLAAQGGLLSGGAIKEAQKFNQDYAGNAFKNYYDRWANTTGAKNQLLANKGNINSQGTVAGANSLSSALSGALNPTSGISSQDLLKLLAKQNQGTSLYG